MYRSENNHVQKSCRKNSRTWQRKNEKKNAGCFMAFAWNNRHNSVTGWWPIEHKICTNVRRFTNQLTNYSAIHFCAKDCAQFTREIIPPPSRRYTMASLTGGPCSSTLDIAPEIQLRECAIWISLQEMLSRLTGSRLHLMSASTKTSTLPV